MIDSFRKECVQIGTRSKNKKDMIREISQLARRSSILSEISVGEIEDALFKREEIGSTGLREAIAIPHCSFRGLENFVVGLIVDNEGVDFDSIDGKKCKYFFFIIGPMERRNRHIKILSSISKLYKDKNLMDQIIRANSESLIFDLLEGEDEQVPLPAIKEKCQFMIHVQKEDLFFDILEVLSSEVEGSVSVIDGQTAGAYLYRLPLFSSFWNEKSSRFSKIIVSVVDKRLMNETVRRINMVLPEEREGVLISVSDLTYFDGSIDF